MSRTNWKAIERSAADLFGLKRHPANMGGRADFGGGRGDLYVGQVKNPKSLSLAKLTALCEEMRDLGNGSNWPQFGVVVAKLSNRRPTPHIVAMTEEVWLQIRQFLHTAERVRRDGAEASLPSSRLKTSDSATKGQEKSNAS